MREPQRPDHLVGGFACVTEVLSRMEAGIAVFLQEIQEVVAFHEVELAGLQGLSRQFVRLSRICCMQSQDFPRACDPNDQSLPVPRCSRKLYTATADDVNASRTLTLDKQHRTLG